MKVLRSTICSFKFATQAKRLQLRKILQEYGQVVNFFIERFWVETPKKNDLLKEIVNLPTTTLSARLRKVAAREAIDLVLSSKNKEDERAKKFKPKHYGRSMNVSSTIADFQSKEDASHFDGWLHLSSMGEGVILDLPIKLHKHYHKLAAKGQRLESYIIKEDSVQFCFEVETGKKTTAGQNVGLDTGINSLATLNDGQKFGQDIKLLVENVKRKKHGSKKQKAARRALRQRMDEVAKEIFSKIPMKTLVVEDLKKLNHKTKVKRRLTLNIRRSLGIWAYRYWLNKLAMLSEDNRVSLRRVQPAYTSQRCNLCGHTERANRSNEVFLCRKCHHTDDADVNAAKNILERWASGPYGATYKPDGLNGLKSKV